MMTFQKKLWIGLIVLAVISPLGIILPEMLKGGDAWGEWGPETLEKMLGYIPEGLKKTAALWSAPIADYNFGPEGSSMSTQIISYIISGFLGILICGLLTYILLKLLVKREE